MLDVESTVLDIIARKANVESATLSRSAALTSLTLDSLDIIEIMFQIEETFDVSLPYNANQAANATATAGQASLPMGMGLTTVGDVIDMVAAQAGKADARPAS